MKLTKNLKAKCVKSFGVKADASDDDFRKAVGEALATERLTVDEFKSLGEDELAGQASEFGSKLDEMTKSLSSLTAILVKQAKGGSDPVDEDEDEDETGEPSAAKGTKKSTPKENKDHPTWFKKMRARMTDDERPDVEVLPAHKSYATDRKSLVYGATTKGGRPHPLAGRPVIDFTDKGGRALSLPSELDKAVSGAYAKLMIASAQRGGSKTFGFQSLPQHDKELIYYALEEMEWGGSSDGGDMADINGKLTTMQRKAVIDDAVSGGLEAAPTVFDDMVIQTPLLNGELYPQVNTIPLDRGRRVEGVSTGTVTGSWGGVDDTAISLFNTASYVSAFDTTIFRWEGAIRIGLDFLSDTPIDFGAHVTTQYGERLLEDLDDVVAVGNGTTQPEGIMNKSGATSVNFGGATSLGNYESLRFGVAKKEHRAPHASSAVFCGNETSYQRARAIPVGASDARRLGGMDYSSYQWMERPFKINESMANTDIFYAILSRYRMYRRRGMTIRTSTEGDTLIRANELLITVTARYGGQMERGAAIARTTTAPA